MRPTQDIIDELRKEAAHGPCPRRVSDLLTEAADRLDNLFASGIHTCHADCQRPMCVLRRERDKALAALARVTAEARAERDTNALLLTELARAESAYPTEIPESFFAGLKECDAARAESATPAKFDFAAHDAAFVEWWSREGSGFHPAAIEDREEFTRRVANLAWIISANAARKQGDAAR